MVDAASTGSPTAPSARTPRLLRDRSVVQRVTNIELFFDLVTYDLESGKHVALRYGYLAVAKTVAEVQAGPPE